MINSSLALYIHIPWCLRKCPYCDFNSHTVKNNLPEMEYVSALLTDLEQDLPLVWGRKISSIFFGGGTPSLFSAESIDELISGVRARIPVRPDAEITLEANPGAVEQGKFAAFQEAGINRLSVGVQSFNDKHLKALGRVHDRAAALTAIDAVHQAGIDNFNLDLMYGLPGQTVAQAKEDVSLALSLNPAHISHYQLTLEPNTLFHASPPLLPNEDDLYEMQLACQTLLADSGYAQYEVSAYALPKKQCQHNINYWQFGDYLGIGAGAHGKITDLAQNKVIRLAKVKHPQAYLDSVTSPARIQSQRELDQSDLIVEFMMNALRLTDGFSEQLFEQATQKQVESIAPSLIEAQNTGLLDWREKHIRPTLLGRQFLNDLVGMFDYFSR